MRRGIGIASAAAISLALAGCAASAPTTTSTPAPTAPSFPAVPGEVIERSMPATGDWLIRVRVADPDAGYAAAKAALVEGGYTLTKDRSGTGGGDGQACTDRLCVSFAATADPTAGPSILYEVFHSTGIVG